MVGPRMVAAQASCCPALEGGKVLAFAPPSCCHTLPRFCPHSPRLRQGRTQGTAVCSAPMPSPVLSAASGADPGYWLPLSPTALAAAGAREGRGILLNRALAARQQGHRLCGRRAAHQRGPHARQVRVACGLLCGVVVGCEVCQKLAGCVGGVLWGGVGAETFQPGMHFSCLPVLACPGALRQFNPPAGRRAHPAPALVAQVIPDPDRQRRGAAAGPPLGSAYLPRAQAGMLVGAGSASRVCHKGREWVGLPPSAEGHSCLGANYFGPARMQFWSGGRTLSLLCCSSTAPPLPTTALQSPTPLSRSPLLPPLQGCMYRVQKPYTEFAGRVAEGEAQAEEPTREASACCAGTHGALLPAAAAAANLGAQALECCSGGGVLGQGQARLCWAAAKERASLHICGEAVYRRARQGVAARAGFSAPLPLTLAPSTGPTPPPGTASPPLLLLPPPLRTGPPRVCAPGRGAGGSGGGGGVHVQRRGAAAAQLAHQDPAGQAQPRGGGGRGGVRAQARQGGVTAAGALGPCRRGSCWCRPPPCGPASRRCAGGEEAGGGRGGRGRTTAGACLAVAACSFGSSWHTPGFRSRRT